MYDANLLMNLYKLLAEGKLDRFKFFQMLVRGMVQEVGCSRASVWFYAGELGDQLVSESLYDAADTQWAAGVVLSEDDFGPYFNAMREDKQIVAPHARLHPATACFNESYFEPLNIYSLLNVAIEIDGSQIGFVCCEQTVAEREWTNEDVVYLQKVSAMITLAFKKQVLT